MITLKDLIDHIENDFASAFSFLTEYGFTLVEKEFTPFYIVHQYTHHKDMIHFRFNYDFRDSSFYFSYYNIKKGNNEYPFWKIFLKINPKLTLNDLQPDGFNYKSALELNTDLLHQFCNEVFINKNEDIGKEIL